MIYLVTEYSGRQLIGRSSTEPTLGKSCALSNVMLYSETLDNDSGMVSARCFPILNGQLVKSGKFILSSAVEIEPASVVSKMYAKAWQMYEAACKNLPVMSVTEKKPQPAKAEPPPKPQRIDTLH